MNDTLHAAAGLDLPLARDRVECEGDMQERIRARTRVLAVKAGRVPPHVLQVDYEQAKREFMGGAEMDEEGEGDGGKGCPEGGECGGRFFKDATLPRAWTSHAPTSEAGRAGDRGAEV